MFSLVCFIAKSCSSLSLFRPAASIAALKGAKRNNETSCNNDDDDDDNNDDYNNENNNTN